MTGAILVSILAVACAAAVLAAVLVARRPDEGWSAWVRSAYRAWRRDELSWTDGGVEDEDEDEDVGGLGTLYLMSEPGNAYTTPEELGGQLGARLVETLDHGTEAAAAVARRRAAERTGDRAVPGEPSTASV